MMEKTIKRYFQAWKFCDYQQLEEIITYKQWYFGHYHEDKHIDEKQTLLYQGIVQLDNTGENLSKVPIPGMGVQKWT